MPTISPTPQTIQYSPATLARAERAVRCSPFRPQLFITIQWQSVELRAIASERGVRNGYTMRSLPELVAENELLWLIQVGLLRREVDGQGLTDSFRLTPLGRQLVRRWEQQGEKSLSASWLDQLLNWLNRWFRRPSWLS